jgi:xanthine dehydrogenase YagS FAD-binding subunit
MKSFRHIDARSVDEACALLDQCCGKATLNAGGTDLLLVLKHELLPDYPDVVVNVKTIPGLSYVDQDAETLRIGALTSLTTLAKSPAVNAEYAVLAEAARSVATPQIRNVATLGGNLCQDVRCWYYRYPAAIGGAMECARKGHGRCLAMEGDNRFHGIMNGKRCVAVGPSDMAVALAALDATIVVSGPMGQRSVVVTDFYSPLRNALEASEMVTEIAIPRNPNPATVAQRFLKYTLRSPVDFAVVSVATVVRMEGEVCVDARIALGAVGPGPIRATAAEEWLIGRPIEREAAAAAAERALAGAKPLSMNAYKVEIAKALVKRALLGGRPTSP